MTQSESSEIVQLIAAHQARLRGLVRCLLVRSADVDDVLQEVNAVLWEKSLDFQVGTDFWAWASQVARFKVLNHLRKYKRDRLIFDERILNQLADLAVTRLADVDQRREALELCLNQLPPAQRQLVDLRYAGGHALGSIGEMIGRPEASIRQTLYRVRQALLLCIESKLQAEGGAP